MPSESSTLAISTAANSQAGSGRRPQASSRQMGAAMITAALRRYPPFVALDSVSATQDTVARPPSKPEFQCFSCRPK